MAVWAPKRKCVHPGCEVLTTTGRCPAHPKLRPKYDDSRRPDAAARGYGPAWQKARDIYLKRNPFCVICLQRSWHERATVVDHIVPHKGDKRLFWDQKNWQALCRKCHDRKTNSADGGFGNPLALDRRLGQ